MSAISSDSNIVAIAKTYYTDKKFESLFARNDAFCRIVEKNRVGGKEYRFGTKVYQGGNVAGNYQQLLQNFGALSGGVASTSGYGGVSGINTEFVVTPGTIFTVFQVTQLEELATRTDRQAYVKAVVSKFYDATEGLRKAFAAAAYGTGFGEVGQVNTGSLFYTNAQWTGGGAGTAVDGIAAFPAAQAAMWLQLFQSDGVTKAWDILVKLSIGSLIQFVSGAAPSGAFVGAGTIYVVQAIQDNAIKIANAAGGNVPLEVLTVGNWIVLNGCSTTGNTVPLFPVGLGGWLPTLGTGRATNSAAWQTYINTAFFNVTRSAAPDRLAGSFYKRGTEKRGDALIEGVRMSRRGGGEPNLIVVNDVDYRQILTDFNAQTTYMQQINTSPAKAAENEVQKGLMDMGFQFSTNWLNKVFDSPYCPYGTAYILDMDTIEFAGWSNSKTPIEDTIQGNNPGTELVDSIGDLDLNFKLLIEDYLNVVPGSATVQGPAALVTLSLFGQWCFHNPAHCAVVQF